jgi:hypothetical protein
VLWPHQAGVRPTSNDDGRIVSVRGSLPQISTEGFTRGGKGKERTGKHKNMVGQAVDIHSTLIDAIPLGIALS